VVGMADNIVRPWILSTRTPVNPLLVMVSMLGSAQVFGLIGFVAGPVILAIFIALLRTLREEMAAPPPVGDIPECPEGRPPQNTGNS
jgi:predicted PurR-regulated permease PerM